jgi:hypothetical protein
MASFLSYYDRDPEYAAKMASLRSHDDDDPEYVPRGEIEEYERKLTSEYRAAYFDIHPKVISLAPYTKVTWAG